MRCNIRFENDEKLLHSIPLEHQWSTLLATQQRYVCNGLPQSAKYPIVHCVSTVCIVPRSVAIIPVNTPVVLSEKKIHHLVDSDSFLEGLRPLGTSI